MGGILIQEGDASILWGLFLQRTESEGDVVPGQSQVHSSTDCPYSFPSFLMFWLTHVSLFASQGMLWEKNPRPRDENEIGLSLVCRMEPQGIC